MSGALIAQEVVVEHRWYGAPALGLDAAGILFVVTGFTMEALQPRDASMAYRGVADNLEGAGMAVLALGAPLNHLMNNHPGRAGLSFLARVGMFSTVVLARETSKEVAPELVCAALFLAVVAADDVWLARDEVKHTSNLPSVSPWVDTKRQGGGLAVAGTF